MVDLLEQIAFVIQELIRTVGYPGVFALLMAENFFPPIPTEVVMPFVGFLVGRGELHFVGAWAAAVFGASAGSLLLYQIGVWADEPVVRTALRRWGRYAALSERELDRVKTLFDRHGGAIVLIVRLIPIPVARPLVSITAGLTRMPRGRFLVFTTLGSALWIAVWLAGGVLLGDQWDELLLLVSEFEIVAAAGAVLAVAAAVYFLLKRIRRKPTPSYSAESEGGTQFTRDA